jgi:hypothetical protein
MVSKLLCFKTPEDGEAETWIARVGENCRDFVESADFGDAGPDGKVFGGFMIWFGGFLVRDSC